MTQNGIGTTADNSVETPDEFRSGRRQIELDVNPI